MNVTCEFHYDSAHRLPYVPAGHKCGRLHGHTYTLEVTVSGDVGPVGWVVDFADVKAAVEPFVALLDHTYLNDVPGLDNPTVEVQLPWLWDRIKAGLPGLTRLVLQEGVANSAEYCGPTN